jgi:hypothetical protein
MEKEVARKFIPLVNNPEFVNLFEELLEVQITQVSKGFEQIKDEVELRKIQGKVQALRKLKNIRDMVNQEAK